MAHELKQLVEKREELETKRKSLHDILAEAKGDPAGNSQELDLSLIKGISGTTAEKLAEIRRRNEELNAIGAEVEDLAGVAEAVKSVEKYQAKQIKSGGKSSDRIGRFETGDEPPPAQGWGDLFVESDAYKNYRRGKGLKEFTEIKADPIPLLKTVFETSAGWAPESVRIGRWIEDAQRPINVIDIVPGGVTGQAAIVYMEETTFTNAADFRAEAGAYAENAFAFTEQSVTVRSIGASLPVTDEQMADVPQIQSILNQRMAFTVRQQLDSMLLTASGVAPEWTGVNNLSGVQTQALGSDPVPDAVYKAMDLVRFTGRAEPSNAVFHPNDWQPVRLLKTADGIYIWGNPAEAGPLRIWGIPVLLSTAQTENTGLVGDFRTYCQYFVRQDMAVEMGYVNDDFLDGRVTIRAGVRGAFVGYRPAAFGQITGL